MPYAGWFNQVLLYWDEIYSIIPSGLSDYISKNEHMQRLIETELIQPINPSNYIGNIPNYKEAFLDYVDNPNYPVPHGVIKIKNKKTTKVHIEKLGDIGPDLVERGLASRIENNWYDIDIFTANQFMAYLASVLGKLPTIESEPITDSIQNLNSFSTPEYQNGKISQEIDELRIIMLKDILPAPRGVINPEKLAEFKAEHNMELANFRREIENVLHDVAEIENPIYKSERIDRFKLDIRDEVENLSKQMKSNGWRRITYGNFIGYSSLVFGVATFIASPNLIGAAAAAFGMHKTINDIAQDKRNTDFLKSNYAAYAVMTQQKSPFFKMNKYLHLP